LTEKDTFLVCECLNSLFMNYDKIIYKDLVTKINKKLSDIFEEEYSLIVDNFEHIKKVFITLVEMLYNRVDVDKKYIQIIKAYIRRYFIVYEKDKNYTFVIKNFKYDYLLDNIDKIGKILNENNENNFNVDLLTYIIKNIFESPRNSLSTEDLYDNRKESTENMTIYSKIFYTNLHKVKIYNNFLVL
jgi:hypothetical protein